MAVGAPGSKPRRPATSSDPDLIKAAYAAKAADRPPENMTVSRLAAPPLCDEYLPAGVRKFEVSVLDEGERKDVVGYRKEGDRTLYFRDEQQWFQLQPGQRKAEAAASSRAEDAAGAFASGKPIVLTMVDGQVKARPLNTLTDAAEGKSRPGSRVYVLGGKDELGLTMGTPTLLPAVGYLMDPAALKRDLNNPGTNLRRDRESTRVTAEITDRLRELLSKGYEIVAQENVSPRMFVGAVGDPRTAALFHEGHSGIKDDKVFLLFMEKQSWAEGSEAWGLSARRIPPDFQPSKSLKFIWTNACQAGQAESYYREIFRLPKGTKWLAGVENQTTQTIARRLHAEKNGLKALIDSLPAKKE